jgi:hypothetical protein
MLSFRVEILIMSCNIKEYILQSGYSGLEVEYNFPAGLLLKFNEVKSCLIRKSL